VSFKVLVSDQEIRKGHFDARDRLYGMELGARRYTPDRALIDEAL
jgi:hypothetical protein